MLQTYPTLCVFQLVCYVVLSALLHWLEFISLLFIAHGTYIGHIRLESRKPQQIPIDSEIHFGASTRIYVIRERPQNIPQGDDTEMQGEKEGNLLGLPENETELDVSLKVCISTLNYLYFVLMLMSK